MKTALVVLHDNMLHDKRAIANPADACIDIYDPRPAELTQIIGLDTRYGINHRIIADGLRAKQLIGPDAFYHAQICDDIDVALPIHITVLQLLLCMKWV